jgi:CopG family transcriptional regulator, nickel-responsive regulator
MERMTISVSEEFAAELADFMASHRYDNRSEAIRDLARRGLEQSRGDRGDGRGDCVATLSYVFNHHTRELAKRLTDAHHERHDLHAATMHLHLDHENCLEVSVLRGQRDAVREFAKAVIAERGVSHGHVEFVPVVIDHDGHAHGASRHSHDHAHPKA